MTLQAAVGLRSTTPPPLSPPSGGPAGLRGLSDRYALRSGFFSRSVQLLLPPPRHQPAVSTAPRFSMRVTSKQAYICRDCGYIYNERTPFEKLPDSFLCKVCGAPKRRFRPYEPAVSKDVNEVEARKARKAQIKRDEAVGKALPFAIAVGIAGLAGLYLYLNSAY